MRCLIFVLLMFISINIYSETYHLVTLQYPPYEYEEDGIQKGFVMEMVKEIFDNLGLDYYVEVVAWKRALAMVKDGDADIIFTIYKNSEREEFLDYSKEILMPQRTAFFTLSENKDINYNNDFENIKEYSIGTVLGVSYGKRFDHAVESGSLRRADVLRGDINIKKLLNKRVEIIVSNEYGALYLLKKENALTKIRELNPVIEEVPSYIAYSKKNNLVDLRDLVDKEIRKMKESGRYQEIIVEYFLGK